MFEVVWERSPRALLALVEGLPDDGVLAAHQQGGEDWRDFLGWGKARHMLADQWDLTAAHAMAGAKKKPPHYPRPAKRAEQVSMAAFLRTAKNIGRGA